MATVRNSIVLQDRMTPVLRNIIKSMAQTITMMERIDKQSNKGAGQAGFNAARNSIKSAENALKNFSNEMTRIQNGEALVENGFGKWTSKLLGVDAALRLVEKGIELITKVTKSADMDSNLRARLALINDGTQTNAQLQNKVYAAAQRSRGEYEATASAVAKLGLLSREQFSNNDQMIYFAELMNKAFKVSGASTQERQAGMYQLSQAMAAGKLQGDEFRSIMENAPMLAQAIATYTGKSKGELKTMSKDGTITAQIIKNALFNAAGDIESKFKTMPITFGDAWTQASNNVGKAFQPLFMKMIGWLNNPQFIQFFAMITNGIIVAAQVSMWLANGIEWLVNVVGIGFQAIGAGIQWLGGVFAAAWPLILYGALVLATIYFPMLISALWQTIVSAAIATAGFVTMGWAAMIAGIKAAIAWMMANWQMLLIIAVIVAIVYALVKMGVTFDQVCGVIGGVIGGLYAVIYNIIASIWNYWASFAEFFANVFSNPVYSIKKLFVNLANSVLDLVKSIAQAIDGVFGTKLAAGISNLQGQMDKWVGQMPENYQKVARMEMKNINETAKAGYGIGSKVGKDIQTGISGIVNGIGNMGMNLPQLPNVGLDTAKIGLDNIPKVNVAGGKLDGADNVDLTDETLKAMKDASSRDFLVNYAQLTPQLSVQFGDVRETADVGKIMEALKKMAEEELASLYVEGVVAT